MAISKTTITRAEYTQMVGLISLGKKHYAAIDDIEDAARAILGEDERDGSGHTGDIIYGYRDLGDGLRILGITVVEDPPPVKAVAPSVLDAAKAVQEWWQSEGQYQIAEAPDVMSALTTALAETHNAGQS